MQPQFIVLLVFIVAVVGVVVGRRRRESPSRIALTVVGYLTFMGGLMWASEISSGAILAAGAASLGSLMFTTASYRERRDPTLPA